MKFTKEEKLKMVEEKQQFCDAFLNLLNGHTRFHLENLEYTLDEHGEEIVTITFIGGYKVNANVNADSRFAMIKDIVKTMDYYS